MKLPKQKVKNFIAFLIFALLIWVIFLRCTYLFRDTYRAGRQNIVGFYSEEEDSLDAVMIGASCVYRYWDCMHAWKEYGITSYDYSVGSMSAAATVFAIKDIEKTQKPQVLVFDVRKILSRFPDTVGGIWGTLDAQDYDSNRLAAVRYYCRLNGIPFQEALADMVDIIRYHDNHEALSGKLSWQLWDNRADESMDQEGFYKGFAIAPEHAFVDAPQNDRIKETTALEEKAEKVYRDILEYCKEKNVPLLLVASPFAVTADDMMEFNRMEEIAGEYGIPFLNANRHYGDMELDFSRDFYDENHVNLYGAEKYTDFLAEYILENYGPLEKGKGAVSEIWDGIYERYAVEAKAAKAVLDGTIQEKYLAFDMEAAMRRTDRAQDWLSMADNANITVLTVTTDPGGHAPSLESIASLKRYGLSVAEGNFEGPYLARFCEEVLYGSHTDTEHEGELEGETAYFLSVEEGPQICIGEKNYCEGLRQGIHMVAFDNNKKEVVDSVTITIREDGSLAMEHHGQRP